MAVQYLRLFDATQQFQLKGGQLNVAGRLYVHLEATDDLAALYDENGVQLSQPVILDNNGRAAGLFVDAEQTYWLDVQDQYGMSQFTIRKMTPCGGGSGSPLGNTYEVVSTDGSIAVDKFDNAGVTTFDIGLAPSSTEFLEWCKCLNLAISNGLVYPEFAEGSMTTDEGGLHVYKDRFYHITCTLRVDPTGNGINYDTLSATLKYSDGTEVDLVRRNYDIDNSVNDPTLCEFSYDFNCPADGYLYLHVEGVGYFEQVDVALQVHRVYSGINAVPDTCATQQWVRGYFDFNMSAHIPYSALEYDSNNEISGISGSAIAGNINSAQVSAIASSYAESAVSSLSGSISSKLDASASSMFQPSGNYYSATNPSGFITTADMSGYAHESALSSKLDASASSDFYSTSNPSGFITGVDLSPYQTTADMSAYQLTANMSGYYTTANESGFIDSAYVDSAVSGKIDSSAASAWIPYSALDYSGTAISGIGGSSLAGMGGGDYTGVAPVIVDNDNRTISVDHKTLCVDETMTAYNSGSSAVLGVNTSTVLSGKLDASASSNFALSGDYAYNSSVSSKLDASASSLFAPFGDYAYNSALSSYIPESASGQFAPSGSYADASSVSSKVDQSAFDDCCSAMSAAVSAKLDASASSDFYSTSNPSGFITGVDLSDYQPTSAMTAYAYESSLSSKLDASAASGFYTTANESGFVDSAYVDSAVSGKQDVLTFAYDADSAISSINGSALAGGGVTGDYVEKSAENVTIGDSNSASSVAFAQGWNNYANNDSFAQGSVSYARGQSFAQGGIGNSALGASLAQGQGNSAVSTAFAQGVDNYVNNMSFAQGILNTASGISFAQGLFNSAINTAVVFGQFNLKGDGDTYTGQSAAFAIGDGADTENRHDLMLVTKDGEITMYSGSADTAGLGLVSSICTLSASNSAKQDSSAMSAYQLTADMSAYQPSGAYIYASALGIAEV